MITFEQLKEAKDRQEQLYRYLDIDNKKVQWEEEQLRTQAPGFWDDQKRAEQQMKLVKGLEKWINDYNEVSSLCGELDTAFEFYKEELVTEQEVDEIYSRTMEAIEALEMRNMLRQEEDQMAAVLKINSGAGGTEAQDWAQMLMRMYMRWAETNGYKCRISNLLDGDDAGIKTCTLEIEGPYAYGYLKSENGVHRLVRISPFNAAGKRQTSFVSCDVTPDIEEDIDIEVKDEDIRIDTYRSSGAGGQHINKTSSAVRITHIPTGVVVACQSERSQIQNRETAMNMLKAKLFALAQAAQMEKIEALKGNQMDIAWGSQIRSYVFCPYTMVKDHRTKFSVGNIQGVMDGDLDEFMNSYLVAKWKGLPMDGSGDDEDEE